MKRFVEALKNMFRIPDLRNRVLFTLALLGVYRIGAHIPTPGINAGVLDELFKQAQGSVLGIFDLFSGGSFRQMTIFALGIMPYITASIILQLMQVVFPYLERLQKEGELGRRKITQYTRYLTIVLSVIQSLTIASTLQATSMSGQSLVYHPGIGFTLMTILTLTTGSAFIMWLGEQISERGIGNGMSLIIFVGIVVGLPRGILEPESMLKNGDTLLVPGIIMNTYRPAPRGLVQDHNIVGSLDFGIKLPGQARLNDKCKYRPSNGQEGLADCRT
jgi:preprotein translocase subunit SecY